MTEQVDDAVMAPNPSPAALGGWRVSYRPGSWLVLSGPSSLVMLDARPGQADEFINGLWEDIVGAASVSALVGRLAARGLDRIADLAVLFLEDGVMRTLVRGGVRVLDADTGASLVDGAGVITWRESQIATGRVHVDVGQDSDGPELPLVVGAAQCSGLLVDLDGLPPVAVAESRPAETGAGSSGEQWHPVGPGVPNEGAAAFTGSALGADHHRDWGAVPSPAPEPAPPAEKAAPAAAATERFDAVAGDASGPYGRPESSYEQQGCDEPTDAAPMNWMAQRPRDDSFMYEKTEVLGGPGEAPQAPQEQAPEQPPLAGPPAGGAERTLGQDAVGPHDDSEPSRADWVPSRPRAVAQVVTLSGLSQPLDGPLLVGRSPQPPGGMTAGTMRVPSPHHDISRSHVHLEPKDGQILVTDMNSTNGTIIYMPNANPLRLENGQSILVPVGTTLDLGDGEQINLSVPLG